MTVWACSYELRLRALLAPLLCVAGLALATPGSASAAGAPVAYWTGHFVYSNGATSAQTLAFVQPRGATTKYGVSWAKQSSEWCVSAGAHGTPEETTEAPHEVSAGASEEAEPIEITGLENKREYCVQGHATSLNGSSTTGSPVTFEAGAPTASALFAEQTGAGTAVLFAELASAGQPTQYEVTYGEAFSEWCFSHGERGSPAGRTGSLQLPVSGNLELLAIPVQGLADGREYCAILSANNLSAGVATIASEGFPMGYILTVLIGGSGAGKVHTNSSKISCPGRCSAAYLPSESPNATLDAEPAAGSVFAGWSICPGVRPQCNFKMNADETVTATFNAIAPAAPPPPTPPATNPPLRKGKPSVNAKTGEIEFEYEFPEAGEAEAFGEVTQGSSLLSVPAPPKGATRAAAKQCKKGQVRRGKRCVSNAPVRYGKVTLAVAAASVQKLHIKPSAKILAALKQGKTLAVRVTLVFTPVGTSDHLTQTSTVTLRMKKSAAHSVRKR